MAAAEKSDQATKSTVLAPAPSCARPPRPTRRVDGGAALGSDETLRQCAATRQVRPVTELIRFVAGPDDRIYPDLGGKLPGRGIWVTADHTSIAQAVKTGAFPRSLKRKIEVPVDLASAVEQLLLQRVGGALSLTKKAGNLVTGFDKVATLIDRGRAAVLIHALDAAPGGIEKLDRKMRTAERANPGCGGIILRDCLTIEQMSLAIGRANVVHAGASEGGATARFIVEANRLIDFRTGVGTSAGAGIGVGVPCEPESGSNAGDGELACDLTHENDGTSKSGNEPG